MACSDNVVRAGLTPKFKDVDTLVAMLTYSSTGRPAVSAGAPLPPPCAFSREYPSPVPEFLLQATALPGEGVRAAETLPVHPSPSIFIVLQGAQGGCWAEVQGKRIPLGKGSVWFSPAGEQVVLSQDASAGAEGLVVYRALANSALGK
jgi:mannose-6-phosphate isomerase